ncbi:MAG: hypothetical protein HXY37_15115 [Chloroflexi bacterium]|nr:hypothetical protein [Chloroflexota bacterium]
MPAPAHPPARVSEHPAGSAAIARARLHHALARDRARSPLVAPAELLASLLAEPPPALRDQLLPEGLPSARGGQ